MAANANSDLSTIASPAGGAVPHDLPVAQVIERTLGVSVTWGDDEGTTQPNNNLYSDYFVARKANGNEPAFKVFGSLLHCDGGTLTIQGTEYRIQVIQKHANGKKRFRFGSFCVECIQFIFANNNSLLCFQKSLDCC